MDGCIAGSRRGIALHARVIIYRSFPAAYSPIRAACTRCLRVIAVCANGVASLRLRRRCRQFCSSASTWSPCASVFIQINSK